jgi:hypothetical protein
MTGRPRNSKLSKIQAAACGEHDGQETWSRQELETMNDQFASAMMRAIRAGREHVPSSLEQKNSPDVESGLDQTEAASVAAWG